MACPIGDFGCYAVEGIFGVLATYVIPIVLVLVALFVFPRIGKHGWILSLIVIAGVVVWFVGIPGLVLPVREMF